MPAWRILVCVCFAIGFALSSQVARSAQTESTAQATIRIVVSHVPTLARVAVPVAPTASRPDRAYCVNASVHAAPHRLVPATESATGGSVQSVAIAAGAETCIDSLPSGLQSITYRIVPE